MLSSLILITSLTLSAYFIGSTLCAVIVSRLFGLPDPRTTGSNNPGATNVLRTGNKKAAILTLIGDSLKGVLAVWLTLLVIKQLNIANLNTSDLLVIPVVMAFFGHLYPVFFAFKGGKGVATFLGVLAALHWPTGLIVMALWLLVAMTSRYSALAAILAAIATPFIYYGLTQHTLGTLAFSFMACLLVWRHKENIQRLLMGTESKIRLNQKSS